MDIRKIVEDIAPRIKELEEKYSEEDKYSGEKLDIRIEFHEPYGIVLMGQLKTSDDKPVLYFKRTYEYELLNELDRHDFEDIISNFKDECKYTMTREEA